MIKNACPACGHRFGWRDPRMHWLRRPGKEDSRWHLACRLCATDLRLAYMPKQRLAAAIIYVVGVVSWIGLVWHRINPDSAPSMEVLLVGLIAHLVLGFWQVTWPRCYVAREPARHSEARVSPYPR